MRINNILLILIISLNACNSSKAIKETTIHQINFGSGGGITGEVVEYKLNDNGKVFNKNQEVINQIKKSELLEIFNEAKLLLNYKLNSPQNMYYFIDIYGKNDTNRLVWGLESKSVNEEAKSLYNKLNNQIKSK